MAIPKKHQPRLTKFVEIVLGKVITEEICRNFNRKGKLDDNYTVTLYSTGLLPMYNDDRIEVCGDINDKKIEPFFISGASLAAGKLDKDVIPSVVQSFMKLRIKEIK